MIKQEYFIKNILKCQISRWLSAFQLSANSFFLIIWQTDGEK